MPHAICCIVTLLEIKLKLVNTHRVETSVSVKRRLRVFYPQNLGQDAQKNKDWGSKDAHNFLYDA